MSSSTTSDAPVSTADPLSLAEELLRQHPPATTPPEEFLGRQFDFGLAFPTEPPGRGGTSASRGESIQVAGLLRDRGAPNAFARNPVGIGMAAPTIARHASDELAAALLRPLFTSEEIWCQLFSEPEAGSDLANVSTRAVNDGGTWTVSGQKVWTSLGHVARWGLLLTRTGNSTERNRGLTYFVLDMRSPGVSVRPLRQMTGDAEYNEVFLTEVRVSDAHRLGDLGDGWNVARTTLASERSTLGAPRAAGKGAISHLVRIWKDVAGSLPPEVAQPRREEVVSCWIESELIRLNASRARASNDSRFVAANPMLSKIAWARSRQRTYDLATTLLGPDGMLYPPGYEMVQTEPGVGDGTDVRTGLLRSRANSIEGGSSEILRNIIAERALGLPRS